MKNSILFIMIISMVVVFSSCSKNSEKKISEKVVKPEPTKKELWLKNQNKPVREFVAVIDSLNPLTLLQKIGYDAKGIRIDHAKKDRVWTTIIPHDVFWEESECNEESGEKLSTKKFTSHFGNCYMLTIEKSEHWQYLTRNEEMLDCSYFLSYGILLEQDTFKGKIFSAGTYVVSDFINKEDWNRNHYQLTYFNSYEKFLAFILKQMEEAEDVFSDVNGAQLYASTIRI